MASEDIMKTGVMTAGIVTGPFAEEGIVCQYPHMVSSNGIWFGDNPLDFSAPVFLAQIILSFFASRFIFILLKPLRQSIITAQVLAGVIMGPTILGRFIGSYMMKLFPLSGKMVLQTAANIGFLLHLFVLGVHMDTRILRKAGGAAVLIGTIGFVMPYALAGLTYFIMNHAMPVDESITTSLPFIVAVNSMSSFPVITTLLADLHILNSEIGRLATYASMVSDLCSWVTGVSMTTIGLAIRRSKWMSLWALLWIAVFLIAIVFVFRPFILWLTKRTPEGRPMKETHFVIILLIVLGCAVFAEVIGQHAAFGPFLMGIALPDGPPLGSSLVEKLDTIATGLLLPVFIAISGLQTDLLSAGAGGNSPVIIEAIIIMGYVGKFGGTLLPALYCGVPSWEAVTLALIMCSKGIIEVATYIMWKDANILDDQTFSLLLITMLLVSGLARPMVRFLYDPSRRYTAPYGRRTILQSLDTVQLRILVCINQEDNVPMILNLLEASNSTRFSPISIFVLHLVELTGSASAILVPHHHLNKTASNATSSEHVVGAFTQFEQQHLGSVVVQHFTAVAPYASMHNDICSLALDKRTTIVIVPFHKQWAIDGQVGASAPSIRTVNRNVINMAPCSVGVLIERGNNARGHRSALTTTSSSSYRIGLLFFGGADDLEALAYSRRMAQHSRVNLTVVRFIHERQFYAKEKNIEDDLIREFIANAVKGKNQYKEEIVEDGVETTQAIHAMEDDFDLVMVGRYHEPNSPLMLGLTTEWSDCPELGVIGDMLTNLDQSQFSVLVVQQQPQEAGHCPPLQTIPSLPISNRSKSLASKVNSEFSDDEDFTPTYARFEQGK